MQILKRGTRIQPSTLIEEDRSAELVFTTGATVKRYDFEGMFHENLVVSEDAIDLTRLQSGAPLLDTHSTGDTSDVIGVVEKAWIFEGLGYAKVRFSDDPKSEETYQKVRSGILKNLSVGYSIDKSEFVSNDEGERVLQVSKWTPHEISIVPVPADAGSQFRNLSDDTLEVAIEPEATEEVVTEEVTEEVVTEEVTEEVATEEVTEEVATEEVTEQRVLPADIMRRCLSSNVADLAPDFLERNLTESEFAQQLSDLTEIRKLSDTFKSDFEVNKKHSLEEVRKLILDKMLEEDEDIQARFIPDTTQPEPVRSGLNAEKIYAAYRKTNI